MRFVPRWTEVLGIAGLFVVSWRTPAFAYRPFDGTDAAVAGKGEVEVELGPLEFFREGPERSVFVPDSRLNYGFADRWEVVIEGLVARGLSPEARKFSFLGDDIQLKTVLREGVLQDKPGPSVATEFGVLLPGINEDHGIGADAIAIFSQRWPWGTVHLYAETDLTRDQHALLWLDSIVEGPHDWPVRPVVEVFWRREFGVVSEKSALVGAIWVARENLAVDFGIRRARVNDLNVTEIRAGVTFSFALR